MSDHYNILMLPNGLWLHTFTLVADGYAPEFHIRGREKATEAMRLSLDCAEAMSSLLHAMGFDHAVIKAMSGKPDQPRA